MSAPADVKTRLARGQIAVRSAIRLGGWLVHGADGYAEVRFEVDDIVHVVPIGDEEALRWIDARTVVDADVLVLGKLKRAEVETKTVLARHGKVLGPWHVSVRWGSTSEHQGGTSFRAASDLDELQATCARLGGHARAYSRNPAHAHRPDRLAKLLDAVNDREGTIELEVGQERGMLVSTPSPFAGQPYGLAAFEGDRVVRVHMPFGASLLDALRAHLVEHDVRPVRLKREAQEALRCACTTAGYAELLASARVTLHAGFDAPVAFDDPADAERLAQLVTSAFTATLDISRK